MTDVDEDPKLVQAPDDLDAEGRQPALVTFRAAVADEVLQVIRQLHHAEAEIVEQVDPIQVVAEGERVLEVDDDPVLPLAVRSLDVGCCADEP